MVRIRGSHPRDPGSNPGRGIFCFCARCFAPFRWPLQTVEPLVGGALGWEHSVPPELRWQSGRLLTARSSVRSRVEAQCFFPRVGPGCSSRPDTRGKASLHTGGSSAVEQRTVKCASAYAVILWSGVQISPPGYLFFGCIAFQPPVGSRSRRGYCPGANNLSVHSTRVVFIPSKDKIRVRVPMDARLLHGGLLYMVAYNLRKVENRDRYPDPP